MIDEVCAELDADEVVFALEQGQVSAEKVLRAIVCAMPETVEATSTDREAQGARTESEGGGSTEDDAEAAGRDKDNLGEGGGEDEGEPGGSEDDAQGDRERAADGSCEQGAGADGTEGDCDDGDLTGGGGRASTKAKGDAERREADCGRKSDRDREDGTEKKGANDEVVSRALARSELHVTALDDRSDSGLDAAEVAQTARAMLAGREAGGDGAFARIALAAGAWLVPSRVDWRTELEALLAGVGERIGYERTSDSELYRRPQVVLPGRLPTIRRVAIALDTSLSVTGRPEVLGRFLSEVAELIESADYEEVLFLPVDTEVRACVTLLPRDPFPEEHLIGGGGTSFDPPFEYIEEHGEEIDALIYLTDAMGCCTVSEPADYRVIWCITGGAGAAGHLPFGDFIEVDSGSRGCN